MSYYHRLIRLDDRGAAAIEGIIVVAILAGIFLGALLLGMWGTHLQSAQMGARLLAFDAGDDSLARYGRAAPTLPAGWLNTMFVLPNDHFSGRVTGTQYGRSPTQGASLFDFGPAALGYHSGSSAGSNSWRDSEPGVQATFRGIMYYVGFNQETPEGLSSIPEIPPAIPLVETIYGRAGIR
jgi:hypothetical protein